MVNPSVTGRVGTPSAVVNTQAAGTVSAGTATVNLRCRVLTAGVPAGGLVTVQGSGFGADTVIRVGADIIAVVARRPSEVSARMPRGARSGGIVSAESGGRRVSCGSVSIVGR